MSETNAGKHRSHPVKILSKVLKTLPFILFLIPFCMAEENFIVSARLENRDNPTLVVNFSIAADCFLYADKLSVDIPATSGFKLEPSLIPPPIKKEDPFLKKEVAIYEHQLSLKYLVKGLSANDVLEVNIRFQGCGKDTCFLPESKKFKLSLNPALIPKPVERKPEIPSTPAQTAPAPPAPAVSGKESAPPQETTPPQEEAPSNSEFENLVRQFRIRTQFSGYLDQDEFIKQMGSQEVPKSANFHNLLAKRGVFLTLIMVVLSGVALNLTPCVLPMIPVNIAIIGAGSRSSSRSQGFVRGLVYGLGIALAYGALGILVITTGARFGLINSNPWFNIFIAGIFFFLSLSMFGVFHLDFSKYQSARSYYTPRDSKPTGLFIPFLMGALSAVLAGACVAPVVIAVLLFAGETYANGHFFALFLPLLLGIGMALPWPFAGAGLSILPTPGSWMEVIKKILAFFILLLALYYAYLSFDLFNYRMKSSDMKKTAQSGNLASEGWTNSIEDGLRQGIMENRPVFIDFYASWCKNCVVMDKTTFKNVDVIKFLDPYVKVKFVAENPTEKSTRQVLDHFGIIGLPTYIVLEKKQ